MSPGVRRETGKEQEVKVVDGEGHAHHAGPEPCEGPTFASLNHYFVPLLGVMAGSAALGEPVAMAARGADWRWS
jgi:hypothetical protein